MCGTRAPGRDGTGTYQVVAKTYSSRHQHIWWRVKSNDDVFQVQRAVLLLHSREYDSDSASLRTDVDIILQEWSRTHATPSVTESHGVVAVKRAKRMQPDSAASIDDEGVEKKAKEARKSAPTSRDAHSAVSHAPASVLGDTSIGPRDAILAMAPAVPPQPIPSSKAAPAAAEASATPTYIGASAQKVRFTPSSLAAPQRNQAPLPVEDGSDTLDTLLQAPRTAVTSDLTQMATGAAFASAFPTPGASLSS